MFADTATIKVKAGRGGDGALSFRHEKYRAMGGPDGGDGGRGGNVIFRVDHNSNTLSAYRTNRTITAENGAIGGDNRKHGKSGVDVIVKVPQGTQIFNQGELIVDLSQPDQEAVIARGGKGGFGNAHFKSSTRQAPRAAELGEPGEHLDLTLELKLVADIGLIGLPNAGKSTFLSVVTDAKPEIADYAFTTIIPNLGVAYVGNENLLIADIPGLIEGASLGKGLGDDFLRHIERTAVLLHLIDAASADPVGDYTTIQNELGGYQVDLTGKPQLLVVTKIDTVDQTTVDAMRKALTAASGLSTVYAVSAQAHQGLFEVLRPAAALVQEQRQARAEEAEALPVIDTTTMPDMWRVEVEKDGLLRITGDRIEGFALRTNFDQDEAVERLRDILRKMGIAKELRRQGAKDGDLIRIGTAELAWFN